MQFSVNSFPVDQNSATWAAPLLHFTCIILVFHHFGSPEAGAAWGIQENPGIKSKIGRYLIVTWPFNSAATYLKVVHVSARDNRDNILKTR
jgi:hypothetical protein